MKIAILNQMLLTTPTADGWIVGVSLIPHPIEDFEMPNQHSVQYPRCDGNARPEQQAIVLTRLTKEAGGG